MNKDEIAKLEEVNQRSKSNTKRLDDHDKKIDELSNVYVALTKTNDKVDKIETDVTEIKGDLKDIKDKPEKRQEQIIGYILSALISGLAVFIFTQLGMR